MRGAGGQTSKAASSTQSTLLVAGVIFVLGFDELLYVLQRPLLLLAILAACLAGAPRPRPAPPQAPRATAPLPAADARAGARRAQRRGTTWCTTWRTGRPSSRAPPRTSSPRCPRAARQRRRATRPQPRTRTSRTPRGWQGRRGARSGLRRTPAAGTSECCPPARLHRAARRAMYASGLVHRGPAKARETPTAESTPQNPLSARALGNSAGAVRAKGGDWRAWSQAPAEASSVAYMRHSFQRPA